MIAHETLVSQDQKKIEYFLSILTDLANASALPFVVASSMGFNCFCCCLLSSLDVVVDFCLLFVPHAESGVIEFDGGVVISLLLLFRLFPSAASICS